MSKYHLTGPANDDIADTLDWSVEHFGENERGRYAALITTAIRQIAVDAEHPGSKAWPEIGVRIRSWHLRISRDRVEGDRVQQPRHVIFYRVDDDLVLIGRVLHDVMDFQRHLDTATWDE